MRARALAAPLLLQVTLTQEGANLTARQTFIDLAGNEVIASLDGINIDRTRPRIGFRFAHLPENPPATPAQLQAEQDKWHNHAVTLIVDGQDDLSGIQSVTPAQLTFTTEGISLRQFVTVVDRAGNSASDDNDPIKIDLTPPVITYLGRLPLANEHGWNNSDITAGWSCADSLSGIVAANISQTLSSEGAGQSLTGACIDLAGNITMHTHGGLNLDKTAPIVQCVASPEVIWPPNIKMVPVDVALTFIDALSGTWSFAITEAVNNETGASDIAGFTIGSSSLTGFALANREGNGSGRIYSLGYEGGDRAGNVSACETKATVPRSLTEPQ